MKIEPPKVGTRWYKFMDPANKARIVQVIWTWGKVFCPSDNMVIISPEIDGRTSWTIEDFVRDFRPL